MWKPATHSTPQGGGQSHPLLISYSPSSGVAFYRTAEGLFRFDLVTAVTDRKANAGDGYVVTEFDQIEFDGELPTLSAIKEFVRAEYLRDKKYSYYLILFTKELPAYLQLKMLQFLNEDEICKVQFSDRILDILSEAGNPSLVFQIRELSTQAGLKNVLSCFRTELSRIACQKDATAERGHELGGLYAACFDEVRRASPSIVRTDPLPRKAAADTPAIFGAGLRITGEIQGNKDVNLDGDFEGVIKIGQGRLTIGVNAAIKANISAREVIILGKVTGNITAIDRVEIRIHGNLVGDISCQRIVIEDGAYFKGGIDIKRQASPSEVARERVSSTRRDEPEVRWREGFEYGR